MLFEAFESAIPLLTLKSTATSSRFYYLLSWLGKLTSHHCTFCDELLQNKLTAFSVDKIFFLARPRNGVGHIGHVEFLSRVYGGRTCQPFDICATL